MEKYANNNGSSGITGYEIGADYIDIAFADGSKYRYSAASAGAENVEELKRLAAEGSGLNSFLNRNCRTGYERKM